MERPIEISSFHLGELRSTHVLSEVAERRAAVVAGLGTALLVSLGMATAMLVLHEGHRIVNVTGFVIGWVGAASVVAFVAARRAQRRESRYVIGAALDADAFGVSEVDLIRRCRGGYRLGLVPGMTGIIENGRSPLPIESLVSQGSASIPLPDTGSARVHLGPESFIVRRLSQAVTATPSWRERLHTLLARIRRHTRLVAAGIPAAAFVTFVASAPSAQVLEDKDMVSSIRSDATPWEAEQQIRTQAQRQVSSLHACFDPLPLTCQRPGFVGVGVSLSKQGEILSHWVARSTFGADCPVANCMAEAVSGWFFESLPEPMKLVLPIQVRRTNKPLQIGGVAAETVFTAASPQHE